MLIEAALLARTLMWLNRRPKLFTNAATIRIIYSHAVLIVYFILTQSIVLSLCKHPI